jgi:D-alanyl-D-alanine carboxypeptidase
MSDDIDNPGLRFLGSDAAPSVSVSVGAPSIYDNAKALPTPKAPPDIENLQPDLRNRITKLQDLWKNSKEFNPKGEDLPITSGYRTLEQQREEYKNRLKNPNLVAEPGTSRHEKGDAIDLHPMVPDVLLNQVGLFRPLGKKDPVHVQINPDIPYESNVEPNTGNDIENPGLKFIDQNYEKPTSFYQEFKKPLSEMSWEDWKNKSFAAPAMEYVAGGLPLIGDEAMKKEGEAKLLAKYEAAKQGLSSFAEHPGESIANLAKSIYENPGRAAGEVVKGAIYDPETMVATPVGKMVAKTAEGVATPISAIGGAVGRNVKAGTIGNIATDVMGIPIDKSGEVLREAARSGYKNPYGTSELAENMRGNVSPQDLVEKFRSALENTRHARSEAYKEGIATTKGNQVFLDFSPIRDEFNKTLETLKSRGVGGVEASKVGPETMSKVNEIKGILDEWESKPELHTAGGLDDLKQRIDDVYSQGMTNQAKRVLTNTRNKVKETIVKQDKNYEKTMSEYEDALATEREVEKSLGLGPKASIDLTLRRLKTMMGPTSTMGNEFRRELTRQLEENGGKNLMEALAGQSLKEWHPSGLAGPALGMNALYTTGRVLSGDLTPISALAIPFQSPRVMGELMYKGGQLAGRAKQAKTRLKDITSRE